MREKWLFYKLIWLYKYFKKLKGIIKLLIPEY